MSIGRQVVGGAVSIDGRKLSVSKAIRAGDFVFLAGQIPIRNGEVVTDGSIEDQTRIVLNLIKSTLAETGCVLADVVKSTVWMRDQDDFAGFNAVYGEYFPAEPPARSAVVSDLLVDVRVEVEVVAYRPMPTAEGPT